MYNCFQMYRAFIDLLIALTSIILLLFIWNKFQEITVYNFAAQKWKKQSRFGKQCFTKTPPPFPWIFIFYFHCG